MRLVWYAVYGLLFFSYLALEIAGYLNVHVPWLGDPSRWAPVPIGVLLFLLVYRAAELTSYLKDVPAQLAELKRYRDEIDQLKNDVGQMREQIRSSDALLHGKLLFYQGDYDEAASVFEEIVDEDPDNPQNRYWLGLSLLRADKAREALSHLTKAVDATENPDPELLKLLGEAEFRCRMPEQAEHHLQQAIEGGVSNKEATQILLAKVQLEIAPERAMSTLREVVENNPYNGNAVRDLAEILIEERSYDQAVEICDKALSLNPRNWVVYSCRAEALLLRNIAGDWEKAKEDLQKARLGNPRDYNIYRVEAQYHLGQAHATNNPTERERLLREAVNVYNEGLGRIPGGYQAALHAALSSVYIELGEPENAEEAARKAVDAYPEHISNHLALCEALLANKRWASLQRAAQKARDVGGRPGRIYSYLYEILAALAMGERLQDLKSEIRNLIEELRAMPALKPERSAWQYIGAATGSIGGLSGQEKELRGIIVEYLDGSKGNTEFVSALERMIAS